MFVGLLLTGYSGRVEAFEIVNPVQTLVIQKPKEGAIFVVRPDKQRTVPGSVTGAISFSVNLSKEEAKFKFLANAQGTFLHDDVDSSIFVSTPSFIDLVPPCNDCIPVTPMPTVSLPAVKVNSRANKGLGSYKSAVSGITITLTRVIGNNKSESKNVTLETNILTRWEVQEKNNLVEEGAFNGLKNILENTEWWGKSDFAKNLADNTQDLFKAKYSPNSPNLGPIFAYDSSVSGYRYDYAKSKVVSFSGDPSTPYPYVIQIPEPVSILGSGVAVAFGIAFKRELGKAKKK